MFKDISEVPDDYRHMFYPPKVIKLNFEGASEVRPDHVVFREMMDKMDAIIVEANMRFFLGEREPEPTEAIKLLKRLKYAYIYDGGKRYITYVDAETMKAYRMHDNSYYNGLACPLEEVAECKFDRWCRGMDL